MASNNDNSGAGAGAGIALVFGLVAAVMVFAAVVLAFFAFVLTFIALLAWNSPLRLGKWVVTPDEARAFVGRGLIGALAVPAFCAFVEIFLQIEVNWDLIMYMIVGGYTLGSIGIEIMMAEDDAPSAPVTYIRSEPQPQLPPPSRPSLPSPELKPFRYASWDDEEAR